MAIDIDPVNSAHYDGNQVPTIMGVVGSAGTADVKGTALPLPIGVDPATGAAYVYNLGPAGNVSVSGTDPAVYLPARLTDGTSFYTASGAGGGTSVQVVHGTVEAVTTVSNITNGSIKVTAGTGIVTSGTVDLVTTVSNLTNGSIKVTAGTVSGAGANAAATVGFPVLSGGMDSGGTTYAILVDTTRRVHDVMELGTINTGTINAGTINAGTINSGTINNGTLTLVTTVSNLTAGSVAVTAGTEIITSGSITVTVGTIRGAAANAAATVGFPVLTAGMDSGGTVYTYLVDTSRRLHNVVEVGTINSGTINAGTINSGTINAGTMTMTVGTLNAGTINTGTINSGTINSGTINAATANVQPFPATQVQSAFAVGTAAIGTLVSAVGAGTGIYVESISLTAMSGTLDMCLSFGLGSTTNQVVSRGLYSAGAGIAQSFPFPSFYGTSNSALTYQILSGAGTASWQVNYASKGTP